MGGNVSGLELSTNFQQLATVAGICTYHGLWNSAYWTRG